MKAIRTTCLLLLLTLGLQARQPALDDLYRQLDEAIEQSPAYVADYEARIASLKRTYVREEQTEAKIGLAFQLYQMYKAYKNDSALYYIQQSIGLAERAGRQDIVHHNRTLLAFQCSTVGMYAEAADILKQADPRLIAPADLCDYYKAQMHLYGELAYYTRIDSLRQVYFGLHNRYRDSIMRTVPTTDIEFLTQKQSGLLAAGKYDDALAVSDGWLDQITPDSRDYAIAAYYRHLVYAAKGDNEQVKYWLAQSALADIRNAVMDQAALITLAQKLNDEGQLDRSYRYIRFTWECNNHFNTRMRSWQITPILNVIEHNYQEAQKRSTHLLWGAVVLVGVLALLLLVLLIMTLRAKRKLSSAQQQLSSRNADLADANRQLSSLNGQLSTLNAELSSLNTRLRESNQVKEEYIGRFMSLCVGYIDKLDNYRKMVQKKMKNKELDELFRITKSTELKEHELDELYRNFDAVFLRLFPNFVDDFNALLQSEYQVQPKVPNRLTTDLRIFALIRLGIEDSSKIAELLHYSVNTIYNYRARTKNGAIGNREAFEHEVKQLGLPT